MSRTALLVLGMHRSGTSALTGALVRLGAQPPATLMANKPDNPRGHYESEALYRYHERLLAAAGTRWDEWTPIDVSWFTTTAAADLKREFAPLLQREFGSAALIAVKDPRVCRFAGFWIDQLAAHGIAAAPILMLRHPLEIAQSLAARDRLPVRQSLLLWLRHTLDAERATRAIPRAFVTYEQLLSDWRRETDHIAATFGLRWPTDGAGDAVDTFLGRELRHHTATPASFDERDPLMAWVAGTVRALDQLAQSPGPVKAALAELDRIRDEFDRASLAFGPTEHERRSTIDALRQTLDDAERQRNSIEQHLDLANHRADHLDRDLDARTKRVGALEQEIAQINTTADGLHKRLDAANHRIQQLDAELDVRNLDREAALRGHAEAESLLHAANLRVQQIDAELNQRNLELAAVRDAHAALDARLDTANRRVQQVEAELHQRGLDLAAARDAHAALDARLDAANRRTEQAERDLNQRNLDLAAARHSHDESESRLDTANRLAEQSAAEAHAANLARQLLHDGLVAKDQALDAANQRVISLERLLHARNLDLEKARTALGQVERTFDAANRRVDAAEAALHQRNLTLQTSEAAIRDHGAQLAAAHRRLGEIEHALHTRNLQIESVESQLDTANRRVEDLDLALSARSLDLESAHHALDASERRALAMHATLDEVNRALAACREDLSRAAGELERIHRSRVWRMLTRLRLHP